MRATLSLLRQWWVSWNLRLHYAGDRRALNRLHWLRDPWRLRTSEEEVRFEATSRIIREQIGQHFGAILEIGCAEGLQTGYLAPLADSILGIDVSKPAIRRARLRGIPNSRFEATDPAQLLRRAEPLVFDLVTACEVLYYVPGFEGTVEAMKRLGRCCVVTYYEGQADLLDPYFGAGEGYQTEIIQGPKFLWKLVWWRNTWLDEAPQPSQPRLH